MFKFGSDTLTTVAADELRSGQSGAEIRRYGAKNVPLKTRSPLSLDVWRLEVKHGNVKSYR